MKAPARLARANRWLLRKFWQGSNPATFIALLAPVIINKALLAAQWQIGFLMRNDPDQSLLQWVSDTKFLGLSNYVVQIYTAILAFVFWFYAAYPYVFWGKRTSKERQAWQRRPRRVRGIDLWFAPISVVFTVLVFVGLISVGRKDVLELYLDPRNEIDIFITTLPPLSSSLTWIRVGVIGMSIWLSRIIDLAGDRK